MPSMYEIYDKHAAEYDELVDREDCRGELRDFVTAFVRPGDRALEAGTGTGRVTALYAERVARALCCDRSAHMLERARARLAAHGATIEHRELGNLELARAADSGPFDLVVEGWSFGHTVSDFSGREDETCDALVAACRACLAPGGRLLFLETLGTNSDEPAAPAPFLDAFYRRLEDAHGFSRTVLRTDYRFPSVAEARRVMGFFFGEKMAAGVEAAEVIEWTGAWTLG
ncbi:MAG: class I SAM-dependent methyltransferase [Spirochaetales bacterium]|nr:class I SAM-dependent methyltransferase [Spirochaetales bacterium]